MFRARYITDDIVGYMEKGYFSLYHKREVGGDVSEFQFPAICGSIVESDEKSVCRNCEKVWDIPFENLVMMLKMTEWKNA